MSSMAYNAAAGLSGMLKEGSRHLQDEATGSASVVLRNIDACLQLSRMLQSSMGPQGRCKLVVNHLEKILVTSDCAAILKEVQIEHPTANLLAMAVKKQEEERGDQTNFVLTFCGELLWQTALLIQKMTWQTAPEILAGYQQALELIEDEYLPKQVCETVTRPLDKATLLRVLTPVLQSKQYGSAEILAPLVADACLMLMAGDDNDTHPAHAFGVESIRTVSIPGTSVRQSTLLPGYVARRRLETNVTSVKDAKIAVYATGIEASSTEAKGTVVMKTAADLQAYNRSEEDKMRDIIAGISAAGVKLVVSGGNISDMALHFLDKHGLACLRVGSKWELRRLCQAVGATALVRLGTPLPDEMGFAKSVQQQELGDQTVTVFDVGAASSKLATIVLRASTKTVLADLERATDDGIQAVAQILKDGRLVYGGGCVEMACSTALLRKADQVPGLAQYALEAFGKALQIVPRVLAENAGYKAATAVANLQAAHAGHEGDSVCDAGIEIDKEDAATQTGVTSMREKGVVDVMATKLSALRLAVDAATTILKIDQIIMSKPAGGPKQG